MQFSRRHGTLTQISGRLGNDSAPSQLLPHQGPLGALIVGRNMQVVCRLQNALATTLAVATLDLKDRNCSEGGAVAVEKARRTWSLQMRWPRDTPRLRRRFPGRDGQGLGKDETGPGHNRRLQRSSRNMPGQALARPPRLPGVGPASAPDRKS